MNLTTDAWESQKDIKERTGLPLDDVNRQLRIELADRTAECRLGGDDYLLIPLFRRKSA